MSSEPSPVRTGPASADVRALVEFIAMSLVEQPDSVEVIAAEDGGTTRFELRVADGDVGKVIGRQGRVVRAIRTVLGAAAIKQNRRFMLEIPE
jgi:predicted RNA-binding protein YlqC (UPF0109 family)